MSSAKHTVNWDEVMTLVDGEIPAGRMEYLKMHLKECKECQELLETFHEVSEAVNEWRVTDLPSHTAAAMLEKVQSASTEQHPGAARFFGRFGRRRILAATGGVMAVCALTLVFLSRPASRSLAPAFTDQTATRRIELPPDNGALRQWSFALPANRVAAGGGGWRADTSAQMHTADVGLLPAPMIARSVSLSIVAKDFAKTRASLEAILAWHQGYAADLTVNTELNSARSLQTSLRIPSGELAATLVELKALGTVENESQKGEEVTQQHSDLVARLKNSRETERRLQSILQQRTGKMSDVLEVEQEITRVRGEIEGMEAEQKGLDHRVDFASVDLRVSEEFRAQLGAPSLSNRIRNAVVSGFQSAADTIVAALLFSLNCGPTLLLWLAILFVPGRLVWRRSRAILLAAGK
jgi:hypothetical protein